MKNQDLLPMTKALAVAPFPCLGCIHYHGKYEFGIPLICGHQPSGPIADHCPHKETRQ